MKHKDLKLIKRLADIYLKKKGVRLGSIKKILSILDYMDNVFLKIILEKKREYRFLSNIYIGIMKDLENKYYLYYRCPYKKKMVIKKQVELEQDFFTYYHKNIVYGKKEIH